MNNQQDKDVIDLAFAIAATPASNPWETRIDWKQGDDGLPHPAGVTSTAKTIP